MRLFFLYILLQIDAFLALTFLGCSDSVDDASTCSFRDFNQSDILSICFVPELSFQSLSLVRGPVEFKVNTYEIIPNAWNIVLVTYKIQPIDDRTSSRMYNYSVNNDWQETRIRYPPSQQQSIYVDLMFDGSWKGSRKFGEFDKESKTLTNCNKETTPKFTVDPKTPMLNTSITESELMNVEDNYTIITMGFIVVGVVGLVLCSVASFIIYKKVKKRREPNFEEVPRDDQEQSVTQIPLQEFKTHEMKITSSDSEDEK